MSYHETVGEVFAELFDGSDDTEPRVEVTDRRE